MYRFIRAALLLVCAHSTLAAHNLDLLKNKTVLIDVSGVLFDQDMLGSVYSDTGFPEDQKVDVASLFHHPLMVRLLGLAHQYRPFGHPEQWYNEVAFPYELYALFTGRVDTYTACKQFIQMVMNAGIASSDPLYQFIASLFDHEHFNEHMSSIIESEELLAALSAVEGVRLVFYSNMPQGFVDKHTKLITLAERYNAQILTASNLGQLKPASIFYAELVKFVNNRVDQLVLIDDKHEDLTAAQQVGISTYHFNRTARALSGTAGIIWQGTQPVIAAEAAESRIDESSAGPAAATVEQLTQLRNEIFSCLTNVTTCLEAALTDIKAVLTTAADNA